MSDQLPADELAERDQIEQMVADGELCSIDGEPHDWQTGTDWMGDPDVPNGTVSWEVTRCSKCGEEQ
jgi:hypothetical protein